LARGRNWDKHNRRARATPGRSISPSGRSERDRFEGLSFYLDLGMQEGGNYVVIPGRWYGMTETDLFKYRLAHRSKVCAKNREWFDRSRGDRLIRISNEVVMAWEIRNCETCASFVRRN